MTENMDSEKSFQQSPTSLYMKRIWTAVIVYTFLDILIALIVLISIYIPVLLVYFVTRSRLNIDIRLITLSFFVLTLLYMLSILIASCWRHCLLIKHTTINPSQPLHANQSNQNTQSSDQAQ